MKLLEIAFVFIGFTLVKGMFLGTAFGLDVSLPLFDPPEIDLIDLDAGCAGFSDCTEYLANVVKNIGASILFVVQLLIELVRFLLELLVLVFSVMVADVDDAPALVNILLFTPYILAAGIITYRLVRSGASDA